MSEENEENELDSKYGMGWKLQLRSDYEKYLKPLYENINISKNSFVINDIKNKTLIVLKIQFTNHVYEICYRVKTGDSSLSYTIPECLLVPVYTFEQMKQIIEESDY